MSSLVAVLRTSPETVIADYARLMRMAGYRAFLPKENETLLKVNIAWRQWYPAASTAPWQLEGVIAALLEDGYTPESLRIAEGPLPGDSEICETNNGLSSAGASRGLPFLQLFGPEAKWIPFKPKAKLPALERLSGPDGVRIPEALLGANVFHLPTMKTHVLAGIAGSAMSAADALAGEKALGENGLDDLIVDLLMVQKEACAGAFYALDGTIAGDGPGPMLLDPYEKDVIIAGADPIAVDAVAARMMGIDPMAIGYIRRAHERGAGTGVMDEIEIAGEDISGINFHFFGRGAGRMPRLADHRVYLDYYWLPFKGWGRVGHMAETSWGQMLQEYLPPGAELERQGKGKGPVLALAALAAVGGIGALRRLAHPGRR